MPTASFIVTSVSYTHLSGASKATQDKYRGVCDNAGVQMALLPRGLLQDATGRSRCV